jgi:2-polyprenyl-3-methyl-5-hydroxy-6-metoxy-1,4-benzoquinol methylase
MSIRAKLILWLEKKTKPIDGLLRLIPNQGTLLDLGCGLGFVSNIISQKCPNLKITGIDPSPSRIKIATKEYPHLNFVVGKIQNIKDKYDTIILVDVIYLLSHKELVETLKSCYEKSDLLIIKTMDKSHFIRYSFLILSSAALTCSILITNLFLRKSMSLTNERKFKKIILKYHHRRELTKILKDIGWQVEIYDKPHSIYPSIFYFCNK